MSYKVVLQDIQILVNLSSKGGHNFLTKQLKREWSKSIRFIIRCLVKSKTDCIYELQNMWLWKQSYVITKFGLTSLTRQWNIVYHHLLGLSTKNFIACMLKSSTAWFRWQAWVTIIPNFQHVRTTVFIKDKSYLFVRVELNSSQLSSCTTPNNWNMRDYIVWPI